ncbi:DNA mismatch repair protein msh-2 [Smittium mucronatum]|uniref:DNA mismatch repair protein MSH2 n=1 Tax=Smittium mucronatum TaxID=133383 RepID=A0A1R0GLP8_9FUNG|nr:DNA mismatch repair protein msh-2 [Smittium mucronatum]
MTSNSQEKPELQLDSTSQSGFVDFFKNLPKNYYSVHGDDAKYVAREVYKTPTVIKYLGAAIDGDKGLPSCTLSKMNAASPGNLQQVEDMLFSNSDVTSTSVVMAVWLTSTKDQITVGTSFFESSSKEFGICQFIDNDMYSNLEVYSLFFSFPKLLSLTIQYQVKECLILSDETGKDLELSKMANMLERCNILVTPCKKKLFNTSNLEQDLNRLLEGEISIAARNEYELKASMTSLSCLIQYLSLLSDESNAGIFTLKEYTLNQFMRLDSSAVKALNLIPGPGDGSNKSMSLLGLLDRCKTAQGSRLISQWIKQPLLDVESINLRKLMDQSMVNMINEQNTVAKNIKMEAEKKLKLEKSSIYGYCFRLSRTDANCIRNKQSMYPELSTQKNGVYFTTSVLRKESASYQDYSKKYDKTQSSLVKEILKIGETNLAFVSSTAPVPYVRPEICTDERSIVLKNSRHPCLESQDDVHFIANDVEMNKGKSEFVIITGPNMGGKSTYIRQVGMIALMAQIGCFVPCDYAKICVFDSILARVGAGDALMKGVSTFMAEMLESASILKTASSNSLIIIDELGRGTSTYDGFGLAWAISEHIITKIGCFCLFATHFHELTQISNEYSSVSNLHVLANTEESKDNSDITLLYKIESGVCDQSFGIHVAKLAKFPKSVVNLAERRVQELESFESTLDSPRHETGTSGDKKHDFYSQFSEEDINSGSIVIEDFLSAFAKTDGIDKMTRDQISSVVENLRSQYQSQIDKNPYLQYVCNSF